jgi:hypothetical protein
MEGKEVVGRRPTRYFSPRRPVGRETIQTITEAARPLFSGHRNKGGGRRGTVELCFPLPRFPTRITTKEK